jgi:hypothetical protein
MFRILYVCMLHFALILSHVSLKTAAHMVLLLIS